MTITILTLFPHVFSLILETSILKHAQEKDLVSIKLRNIRDFATGRRKSVDDTPYGGGVGMVMRVDVLYEAIESSKLKVPVQGRAAKFKERIILLDPKGKRFTQQKARELTGYDHLILICGHYEGVDTRVEKYVDEIISIGDYILTGGEIPAMAITDAVIRLLPGVLKEEATRFESFSTENILEYPQYTRPRIFKGQKVPEVLLSGNHAQIAIARRSLTKGVLPQSGRR